VQENIPPEIHPKSADFFFQKDIIRETRNELFDTEK
jgi:hypothetical protein